MQGMQLVKTEAGIGREIWKGAIWKNSCNQGKGENKNKGSAIHMAILDNYIGTEGFRGFGWLSSSTPSKPDHKSLFQGPQAARTHLCWILRSVLWEDAQKPTCFDTWHFYTKASVDPKNLWTHRCAETQVALAAGQEVGCSIPQASGSAASGSQLTWHSGLGLLFTKPLRLEKTFRKKPNRFGQLYPHKVVYYMKEWTLMEIATWTRWGCCRPGSCSSCLTDVSWLTWRCFPEQLREKETKRASAQVRGGHAP